MNYNQILHQFTFEKEKAIEVLLYIASKTEDLYHILKLIYFADIKHLDKFGSFITGDSYIAMRNGPVPSEIYDIIKHVRCDGYYFGFDENIKNVFKVDAINNKIIPQRKFNSQVLSITEIECLDESIQENITLSFGDLKIKSHDIAYNKADENDIISVEEIAKSLNNENLIDYLRNMYQ